MKLKNNIRGFDSILSEVLKEDFSGNVGGVASTAKQKDKYFPPTIRVAPSIQFHNPDIPMGQDEVETQAPPNMLYPFDSIFSELVGEYIKITEVLAMLRLSLSMPTLTPEKKIIVENTIKQLTKIINELKSSIEKIEQLSV